MTRRLRIVLLQACILCLLFDAAYLAYAVRKHHAVMAPVARQPRALDLDAPRLATPQTSFDFGTIWQGHDARHVFILKNEGREPLVIDQVTTSCGCTATVLDRKWIPAGQQAHIKVSFNPEFQMGPFTKSVTIYSNDLGPPKRLVIRGNIEPLFRLDPEIILANHLRPGVPQSFTVTVAPNRPDIHLDLTNLRTMVAGVVVSRPRRLEHPAGAYRFKVTLRPSRFVHGRAVGTVLGDTGLEQMDRMKLHIVAQVEP